MSDLFGKLPLDKLGNLPTDDIIGKLGIDKKLTEVENNLKKEMETMIEKHINEYHKK
jgi:hypothetical protein